MTTAQASPTARSRVGELAAERITQWQEGYLRDTPKDVAALARLRRGAGRDAAEMPDLWNLIDSGPLHHAGADGLRPLSENELSRAEDALYAALTLFALHQQSRSARMHRPHTRTRPTGLGAAVRRLMPPSEIDEPVRKRLVRAGTAPDLVSLAHRLRDIVVLLRRADVPLDYGLLAGQLYVWQWLDGPGAVRREWGRSFHQTWQQRDSDGEHTTNPPITPDTHKDAS
ncbi:type I-E CRISPR-associated protein Cse2/CasB [Streptomyces massasporeus]